MGCPGSADFDRRRQTGLQYRVTDGSRASQEGRAGPRPCLESTASSPRLFYADDGSATSRHRRLMSLTKLVGRSCALDRKLAQVKLSERSRSRSHDRQAHAHLAQAHEGGMVRSTSRISMVSVSSSSIRPGARWWHLDGRRHGCDDVGLGELVRREVPPASGGTSKPASSQARCWRQAFEHPLADRHDQASMASGMNWPGRPC